MSTNTLLASIPINFQRFELSSFPKHRERFLTGRSNRRTFEAGRIRELERLFLKPRTGKTNAKAPCGGRPLSVGEVLCRSEYSTVRQSSLKVPVQCSTSKGATKALDEASQKPCQEVATGEEPATNGRSSVLKSSKKEKASPEAKDLTEIRCPDIASRGHRRREPPAAMPESVHPAIVALLCDNKRGKGHVKTVENHFISALQPSTLQTNSRGMINGINTDDDTVKATGSIENENLRVYAAATARGGGQLEYDDPLVNPYCRNILVARHRQRTRRRVLRSAFPSITPREDLSELNGTIPNDLDTPGSGKDSLKREKTVQEEQSVEAKLSSNDRAEPREGNRPLTTTFKDLEKKYRKREAEWIASYTPSLRPHDVKPCLGRVGFTDHRLTFDRVQADPSSKMYAAADERFRTTQRYPLETPNRWQLQHKKERQQQVLKLPDS